MPGPARPWSSIRAILLQGISYIHLIPDRYQRRYLLTLSSLILREFTSDFVKLGTVAKLLQSFFFLGVFLTLDMIRTNRLLLLSSIHKSGRIKAITQHHESRIRLQNM